jgi:hypothetical protein
MDCTTISGIVSRISYQGVMASWVGLPRTTAQVVGNEKRGAGEKVALLVLEGC